MSHHERSFPYYAKHMVCYEGLHSRSRVLQTRKQCSSLGGQGKDRVRRRCGDSGVLCSSPGSTVHGATRCRDPYRPTWGVDHYENKND